MTRAVFAIPGDLATRSGGYGYDRELIRQLPTWGIDLRHLALPDGFPFPQEAERSEALAQLASVEDADALLVDGLAFGALPAIGLARVPTPMVALVHHPLALETGLSPAEMDALRLSEQEALRLARAVIVTSDATARTLVEAFGVPRERLTVARPGVMPAFRAQGSGSGMVQVLAVGAVIARKAYDVLIEALAGLQDLPWQLTIIGSLDRDPGRVAALRGQIDAAGLAGRVDLAGDVSEEVLEVCYAAADLFVLPSLYEGYGMVLGEAMTHGLPMVVSAGGAAATTAPDSAALKVPPGDPLALADALRSAIGDADLRSRLGTASWAAGQALPTWTHCAQQVATVLHAVAGRS